MDTTPSAPARRAIAAPARIILTSVLVVSGIAPHLLQAQAIYPFSNTTASPHNTWDSGNNWGTALVKPVNVTGVPSAGMVLRQINVDLGSTAGSNISTLAARLTDPQGNVIDVFNAGYFYNTDFSRYVNIKLRDHALLKRLSDYTNSYLGMPYSFGYYRVETPGSFASLNTTTAVNGTWTFSMIENTGTEIQFNSVALVFGPPFNYTDIMGSSANSACSQSQCLQSGNSDIVLATNVSYPQGQPNYPNLTVNGCNWNAEPNNTAWFHFTATAPTVELSVSGFTNNAQQTIVLRNSGTCDAPAYTMVGCPWSMFVGGCNTTTGDPLLYHRVCYDGGTKFNHGYTLTGLAVGQEYVLIVDGQSGANSTFYIEAASGADNGCSVPEGPEITNVDAEGPGCDGTDGTITVTATGTDLLYSIDGGITFQSSPVFTGLGAGEHVIVVQDGSGATATATVTLTAPEHPSINDVQVTAPGCGVDNGSITITATGAGLQYSIDGGDTFQPASSFADLGGGTFIIVVENAAGCRDSTSVVLEAGDTPVIDAVDVVPPTCAGDDGSITVTATGDGLQYSIDGGITFQPASVFADLGAGTFIIVVENTVGCRDSVTVVVEAGDAPVIDGVNAVPPTCAGDDGSITVTATGDGLQYGIDGGGLQSTPVFTGLGSGEHVIVVQDINGCVATTTFLLEAPVPVILTSVQAVPETCSGDCDGSILATATGGSVLFSLDGGTPQGSGSFTNLCPGTHLLAVTGANGCSDAEEVVVGSGVPVVAGFTATPAEVIPGVPVELTNTSEGAATYLWTFGNSSTSTEEHPVFTPEEAVNMTICLTATSVQGCTDVFCMEIIGDGDIEVPNVMTPNGDGRNDTFGVYGNTSGVTAFSLEVFNRWGQLLFSGDRVGMHWDGRQLGGMMASDGTYFWVLRYTSRNGADVERTGHVTLLR